MKTADLVRLFGSKTAVASFFGITPSAVSLWGDVVPRLRQYELREKRPSIDEEIRALPSTAPDSDTEAAA